VTLKQAHTNRNKATKKPLSPTSTANNPSQRLEAIGLQ